MFQLLGSGKSNGNVAIGIDDGGISFVRLAPTGEGSTRLLECDYRPCSDNATRTETLRNIVHEHQLKRVACFTCVDAASYKLMQIEPPEVEESELKDAMRWRIKDLIDFSPEEAVIDIFGLPEEVQKRHKMTHVVAARKQPLQALVDLITSAGLKINAIDICELALRNIAQLLPESDNGVAILHLEKKSGIIIICRAGELYLTRRLDSGTQQLSEAAANTTLGGSDELSPQLSMLLDGVVLEIQRSLDYYESNFSQPPISALVVAPTIDPIPTLVPYLNANLGGTARQLDLTAILDWQGELPDDIQARCLTTVGAGLRNLVGGANAAG